MVQSRLFVTASERDAVRILDLMSAAFEDDGYALATMEIDEKANIWEASIYCPAEEGEAVAKRLRECLAEDFGDRAVGMEELSDIDWVAKSLEGLRPVRAGRFLVHGSHDRDKVRPHDIAIEIDAGQAFGTGHHGTTAGCLEMIERVMRRRQVRHALDLGTGSGVLAIAITKLAPARVLATDIDPVAIKVASGNSRRNGVVTGVETKIAAGFHADVFAARGPFDLIVANILARPLMRMAPDIAAHATGDVILSGILAAQRYKVLSAFRTQRLYHRATLWRGGWVTLHLS